MLIREAIESGRVEEAVRRVNELDSEVSFGVPPFISFLGSFLPIPSKAESEFFFSMIKQFMHHA
jgi:hypothetical protein